MFGLEVIIFMIMSILMILLLVLYYIAMNEIKLFMQGGVGVACTVSVWSAWVPTSWKYEFWKYDSPDQTGLTPDGHGLPYPWGKYQGIALQQLVSGPERRLYNINYCEIIETRIDNSLFKVRSKTFWL